MVFCLLQQVSQPTVFFTSHLQHDSQLKDLVTRVASDGFNLPVRLFSLVFFSICCNRVTTDDFFNMSLATPVATDGFNIYRSQYELFFQKYHLWGFNRSLATRVATDGFNIFCQLLHEFFNMSLADLLVFYLSVSLLRNSSVLSQPSCRPICFVVKIGVICHIMWVGPFVTFSEML
jgi:hypothetical protein